MVITSLVYLLLLLISCVVADMEQFSTLFSSNINVSTSCQAAINKLSILAINEPQLMAEYWDSWGKPNHGLLKGHTAFLGYYDECIDLKNTAVGDTKFCIYAVKMNVIKPTSQPDEVCLTSDCSTENSADIKIGVCYPSACSPNEFGIILSQMDISSVNTITSNPFRNETNTVSIELSNVDNSATFCPQTDVEYDTGTVAVIVMCGALVGLVVVGTLADIMCSLRKVNTHDIQVPPKDSTKTHYEHSPTSGHVETKRQQPIMKKLLLAFSLYSTVPTLLSTKQSPSAVKGIAGIKIYSNLLITMHHVLYYFLHYQPSASQNPLFIVQSYSRFILQPLSNFSLTVDTFFLLSATLSAYLTLRDIDKHGKFRIAHFYLNRYFRLSILCYFYTLIATKLFVHLGDGPIWYQPDYNACSENWWYNLLYISNNIPKIDSLCLGLTWHVSVDMMLYIFSPIFIVPLYYASYIGLTIVVITIMGATAYIGVVAASNGFLGALIFNSDHDKLFNLLYSRPFFRANPYLIGILLGYILYRNYSNGLKIVPLGNRLKLMMWSVAVFLYSAPVFGIYGDCSGLHPFNNFENACYCMFSGLALSIAISIVIYMCNTGHGGVVNSFLSWPGWEPLVKLSYSVFLVHLMVIFFIFGTLQSSVILTDIVVVAFTAAILIISYGISAVVAVFVEIPIANVVSLCFKLAGINPRDK